MFFAYSCTKQRQIGWCRRSFRQGLCSPCLYHGVMTVTSQRAQRHSRRVLERQPAKRRLVRGAGDLPAAPRLIGEDTTLASPSALALRRLANLLASYTPHDGAFQLRLPGTWAVRMSRTATEASYATLGPALCVAAQG